MEFCTRLHQCLAESRLAAGMFIGTNSPATAELLVNGADLDFIGTDLQHSATNAGDAMHLLRAIQAADPMVTPLVRLPNHEAYWIQQALDAGYVGLIAPLVESAEQAAELVRVAYFPPIGDRSSAGSVRASLYGLGHAAVNERLILLPQIESAKGLERVEEIVAVAGVTGVLLGPEDLSLSCGWFGQDLWSYEPFLAAARRVLAACRDVEKDAAVLTGGFVEARKLGFNIIGIGSDAAAVRVDLVPFANNKLARLRDAGRLPT